MIEEVLVSLLMHGRQVLVIVPRQLSPHIVEHKLCGTELMLLISDVLGNVFGKHVK